MGKWPGSGGVKPFISAILPKTGLAIVAELPNMQHRIVPDSSTLQRHTFEPHIRACRQSVIRCIRRSGRCIGPKVDKPADPTLLRFGLLSAMADEGAKGAAGELAIDDTSWEACQSPETEPDAALF
jgi:hypothetical protein